MRVRSPDLWRSCPRATAARRTRSRRTAFVTFDPSSTTRTFQPNVQDLTYSKYRPDLAALGAVDGFVISGLATDNNDALSRRDQGLEFLDVTAQVSIDRIHTQRARREQIDTYRLTNRSASVIDTHLLVVAHGLSDASLRNASGVSQAGDPFVRLFLRDGVLLPGQSTVARLVIRNGAGDHDTAAMPYTLQLLSGQGQP